MHFFHLELFSQEELLFTNEGISLPRNIVNLEEAALCSHDHSG